MQSDPFDFTCDDGRTVHGRLDRPAGQARGWALFAHCFTCGKDNLAATRISRALAALGVGTLRIDFAGIETGAGSASGACRAWTAPLKANSEKTDNSMTRTRTRTPWD